ncbi:hypothetical protein LTR62_001838 [Meristemomyces frigidus]|uniref:Uncharacterized protein n=1 Tax=Meristemomyces frigidus TaxID=1508187 RepID=A0AAN7TG38_9PEZI|nr:hypothetical protein LTR62_001838 [Meristemomyces frigidus]
MRLTTSSPWTTLWLPVLLVTQLCTAIQLDITSTDSLKAASGTIAYGMMKYYSGNETGNWPGNLPSPYYWWYVFVFFAIFI